MYIDSDFSFMGTIALIILFVLLLASAYGLYIFSKFIYKNFFNNNFASSDMRNNSIEVGGVKNMDMSTAGNNVTVRFFIIGAIALLMLIPLSMVTNVVDERHGLYNNVLYDIAKLWGRPQVISGPVLVLPIIEKHIIQEKIKLQDGTERITTRDVFKNKNVVILPKKLNKNIQLDQHYRYRSIYKSLVYQAAVKTNGKFEIPDIEQMTDYLHTVRYDKAFILMGLEDTKAIQNVSILEFGQKSYTFLPGTRMTIGKVSSGFHAPVKLNKSDNEYEFNFNFKTNGSSSIRFSAFGEVSEIAVQSSWEHPSFQGDILPNERSISADGFSAKWVIPSLSRNFPQTWIEENKQYDILSLLAGVDLYEPVSLYSMVKRSVKYGILFIALSFLTFLIFEIAYTRRLHYAQYSLIGLSLSMFFLTLLALSEHIQFIYSYLIASAITVVSISIYVWFSDKSFARAFTMFCLLSALYTILYSLLQLEDYALLMGTGLLLAILLVLMWITRNFKVTETKAITNTE